MNPPDSADDFTASDGVSIHYRIWTGQPSGTPVLLHHGFASDGSLNWETTGVAAALAAVTGPVVALDARGHGRSGKPHRPASYGEARMASDVSELCTHLALDQFDLVGYSMGGVVSLLVTNTDPRVRRLVVAGLGGRLAEDGPEALFTSDPALADAMEAEDGEAVTDPVARSFRQFADSVQADRLALAAHVRAPRRGRPDLASVTVPTLVVAGDQDPLARNPGVLAGAIPAARLETVPGDHLRAAGSPEFTQAVISFLTNP